MVCGHQSPVLRRRTIASTYQQASNREREEDVCKVQRHCDVPGHDSEDSWREIGALCKYTALTRTLSTLHGFTSVVLWQISFGSVFWPTNPESVWRVLDVIMSMRIPFVSFAFITCLMHDIENLLHC